MAADQSAERDAIPKEMPLLLFHAAGVALGVEAVAVEAILDSEQARQSGVKCLDLAELLGSVAVPSTASNRNLLLKGRVAWCGLAIDTLDELVTIPTTAMQLLPAVLFGFQGPCAFWGGIVRANKVVLLVDVDRLQDQSLASGEALL